MGHKLHISRGLLGSHVMAIWTSPARYGLALPAGVFLGLRVLTLTPATRARTQSPNPF